MTQSHHLIRFNSTMVRLKVTTIGSCWQGERESFNSTMVRLKVTTIGSCWQGERESFNSTMVRLKVGFIIKSL